jgi:hypothetical protein
MQFGAEDTRGGSRDTLSIVAERVGAFLVDPRYRTAHAIILTTVLLLHLTTHYATYVPALRSALGSLPYFGLHVLHEAEFLVVIVYASAVFRLMGGLVAVGVTALTSVPFLMTPLFFGRDPRPGEIRDLATEVGLILVLGIIVAMLYELVSRERERRVALALEVQRRARHVEALNDTIQRRLNRLYDDLDRIIDEEEQVLLNLPASHAPVRLASFVHRVGQTVRSRNGSEP